MRLNLDRETYVSDDGSIGDSLEDPIPGSNVLHSFGQRSPQLRNPLVRIQSNLDNVVEEGKEGGQGEGGYEEGHEPILNHHLQILLKESQLIHTLQVVVLLPSGQENGRVGTGVNNVRIAEASPPIGKLPNPIQKKAFDAWTGLN